MNLFHPMGGVVKHPRLEYDLVLSATMWAYPIESTVTGTPVQTAWDVLMKGVI